MNHNDCVYSKEKRYFVYDPDGGMLFFKTQDEAHKYVKEEIQIYKDGGLWIEGADLIIFGEITHKVEETDVIYRPMVRAILDGRKTQYTVNERHKKFTCGGNKI